MGIIIRLDEVISAAMIVSHHDHIESFLLQEGISFNTTDLGATKLSERQVKELLIEMADGV